MKLLPSADYFRDNIAFRNDTIFGICEGAGQDLGINPNFLRVPLAGGIMVAPWLMLGIYAALGVLVFVSRTFFPDRKVRAVAGGKVDAPAVRAEEEALPRAA